MYISFSFGGSTSRDSPGPETKDADLSRKNRIDILAAEMIQGDFEFS